MIKRGKKGQLKLSFGMIFSIILIIIFISFAVYGIIKIINFSQDTQIKSFENNLNNDVEKVWQSSSSSSEKEYPLPKKVEYVCFANFNDEERAENIYLDELERAFYGSENLFFYPQDKVGYESAEIENLNLNEIIKEENPYCIRNIDGKIKLLLEKDFNENLVRISRI